MIWWYRFLFLPVLLVTAPRYLVRMRRRGGYGENFSHRFGAHPARPSSTAPKFRIWLQAVSVGEMMAVGPLLLELQRAGCEVYLTTTTSTGYRIACERYVALTVGIGYFPLDWWWFSARAWRRIAPDLVLLTEGERWPEHLHQAKLRSVPAIAVNARISERSLARWRRVPGIARWNLQNLALVLCASELDKKRFVALGAASEKLVVTGNIKLDVEIPRLSPQAGLDLRASFGLGKRQTIVGASTWSGEESALVASLLAARDQGSDCNLILVPRHVERRAEVLAALAPFSLRVALRSAGATTAEVDVLVADSTGELRQWLQLGEIVFVGKSLPPHTEGQTPVEAAALGLPLVFGPGMENFRVIADELVVAGAAVVVANSHELKRAVSEMLADPVQREARARAAARWHEANMGALRRSMQELQIFLPAINQG